MRIAPQPGGGLTHASVSHDTAHGRVSVAWRITGSRLRLDLTIPAATAATVTLPLAGRVEQVSGGAHAWEYDLP